MRLAILVSKVSECVLILFRMTCGSAWLRFCRPLLSGAAATPGGYAFPTGRHSPASWRDVPAETIGCSGVTAWRRLRDWTEAGVWPRLHAALLTELRRADLLDLEHCAVDGSHVRALKGRGSRWPLAG